MTRARVARSVVLLALFVLCGGPVVVASQLPEPDAIGRAESLVDQLNAGRFEEVVATFDPRMREGLSEAALRAAWDSTEQAAGAFERRVSARAQTKGEYQVVLVSCVFARAEVDMQVVFDGDGRVAGLAMRPAAAAETGPPPYATPGAFTEDDVVAGTPEWPLPATLSMPVGDGPFPAVVLVHGSGSQDRNASIGPNRLFRDIAQGLAARGIVVLRHEKRFKEHASSVRSMAPFTVKEEAIDDALAGVALLRETPRVDPERVFVIGHSLGGMLAPRIAASDPAIAGLIVMAGAVRSIEQSIVEQTRYLLMADGEFTDDDREQLMTAERLAAEVRALDPGDAAAPEWVGGAPASYWLDLRGYDPPQAASQLPHPFLILQGERDYQVTMADFARWRDALASRANVTFKSYPSLNHVFMSGTGPSLPSEYLTPGHVDPAVIDDIAEWVTTTGRP